MSEPVTPDPDPARVERPTGCGPGAPVADTLVVAAARIGGHVWVEEALFGLTGRWSSGGTPAAAAFFAAQSAFHAWRAREWRSRLPRSVPAPVTAPSGGWERALPLAEGLDEDAARAGVWAGAFVPALAVRYRTHGSVLAGTADDGLARWIDIAAADVARAWADGAVLLDRLAGAAPGALEAALVAEADVRRLLPS